MKIELLFPEICNLFGDLANIEYLHRCLPEAQVIKTSLKDRPAFESENINLIYMGSMTENSQELVSQALMPYKSRLEGLISNGTPFLITGNAMEIFGRYIENDNSSRIEMLDIFNFYSKRQMMKRYNSLYLGKFQDMDIVGFKSQFSHSYFDSSEEALFETVRGTGRAPGIKQEGIKCVNFMSTYVLGPLLILNPPFMKYLLELLGFSDRKPLFSEAATECYGLRLKEFSDPKTGFTY